MSETPNYYSKDWIGQRYGHLTITSYKSRNFECLCDCGNTTQVRPTFLFSGMVKTCGRSCRFHLTDCKFPTKEKLYFVWKSMLYRCYNPKSKEYPKMKKDNITVCYEWGTDFWAFHDWAYKNGYEPGKCLSRKDQKKDFTPDNCIFIEKGEQLHRNRNTNFGKKYEVNGQRLTLSEVAWMYDLNASYLLNRMKRGMTMEEAVNTPKGSHTPAYYATHPTPKPGDVTM